MRYRKIFVCKSKARGTLAKSGKPASQPTAISSTLPEWALIKVIQSRISTTPLSSPKAATSVPTHLPYTKSTYTILTNTTSQAAFYPPGLSTVLALVLASLANWTMDTGQWTHLPRIFRAYPSNCASTKFHYSQIGGSSRSRTVSQQ